MSTVHRNAGLSTPLPHAESLLHVQRTPRTSTCVKQQFRFTFQETVPSLASKVDNTVAVRGNYHEYNGDVYTARKKHTEYDEVSVALCFYLVKLSHDHIVRVRETGTYVKELGSVKLWEWDSNWKRANPSKHC
jgi:hypothetical protein